MWFAMRTSNRKRRKVTSSDNTREPYYLSVADFWDADCAAVEPQKARAARRSVQREVGSHGRRELGEVSRP
jgi:hypothetical protein